MKQNVSANVTQKILEGVKITNGSINLDNITQIGSQTIISKEITFFEPDLKPFEKANFVSPRIAVELKKTLYSHHLLVLGDGINVDKSALARHVATLLKEGLSQKDSEKKVIIKEWYRSSTSGDIEFELDDHQVYKILILTQASPQNLLRYTFFDLKRIAERENQFIIATTDLPFDAWNLLDSCRVWWKDLSQKDVEDCERLINKLSDDEALNNWYYSHLEERGQLLSIGLSLFDGLFDDQFFAALEEVVNKVWKNRDANLKALDYCDLDILRGYFDFIDTDDQRTLVKIRYPEQRLTCLKIAWKSHRRQILLVLPILVNIVKLTVQNTNGELYGSQVRREKLRQSVSEAISGIGLISRLGSREAVEENLLSLAASPDIDVQAVAAQSIASWRDQADKGFILGEKTSLSIDEELFSILESWQTETSTSRLITLLLGDKANEDSNKPEDYIRATLAITIGYASLYDAPGKLSEKLFNLFKDLSKDKNKLVRDRFKKFPLPIFIGKHLKTIRHFICIMVLDSDLISPTAESLALAYRTNADEVFSLIEEWKTACKIEYKQVSARNILGKRESLLATVALTYSHIFKTKGKDVDNRINPNSALFDLIEILKFEKHQNLRRIIIKSIGDLLENEFDILISHIDKAVEFTAYGKETEIFEKVLSDIYHTQRSMLVGGTSTMKFRKIDYPIWLKPEERKISPVEKTLFQWIKDDRKKRMQGIAARCLMTFVKEFENEEVKAIANLKSRIEIDRAPISIKAESQISSTPIIPYEPRESAFLSKFIPWLATRQNDSFRSSVSHILPVAVDQNDLDSSNSTFLTKKLDKAKDDYLVNLSSFLKRGLWLSNYLFVSTFALVALVLFSGFWIREQVGQNSQRILPVVDPIESSHDEANGLPIEKTDFSSENLFYQEQFPKDSCGDPLPSDASLYPVQYYPVFVEFSESNLNWLTSQLCQDVYRTIRRDTNTESIQVASFLSLEQAVFFQEFLSSEGFQSVDVGQPSLVENPPSTSSSLPVEKKGTIEFSPGSISSQTEGVFTYPSVHQFTFFASQGQPSSILAESSSGQIPIDIAAPDGRTLVSYQDGLTAWSATLPETGTYVVSLVGLQAPSNYRLSLVIEP